MQKHELLLRHAVIRLLAPTSDRNQMGCWECVAFRESLLEFQPIHQQLKEGQESSTEWSLISEIRECVPWCDDPSAVFQKMSEKRDGTCRTQSLLLLQFQFPKAMGFFETLATGFHLWRKILQGEEFQQWQALQ